jgi:hypothetical protein
MSVSRKTQPGLFYQLSMTIDYTWEDNSCRTGTKIECFIGETRLPIWKTQPKVHVILNTNVYSETTHKLNIDQHEPLIKKMGLTSGAPKGKQFLLIFANLVME